MSDDVAGRLQNTDYFCDGLPTEPRPEIGKILVTGASGYIGGRLVPELHARGYQVRILVRSESPVHKQRWPYAEIAVGDALNRETLIGALHGIHTAYYLIHSLRLGPKKFEAADIQAATHFSKIAKDCNVKRIIYLGGLCSAKDEGSLSRHFRSRMQVQRELKRGNVPVTTLSAPIIIGSGSASHDIIKDIVLKAPLLLLPCWAKSKCQPIGVRDVIKYLVGVLEKPETKGKAYDIGGRDVLTYEMILRTMAHMLNQRKLFVPSPFSNIAFYSYVMSFFTSVSAPIVRCLMEGVKNEATCRCDDIKVLLPFPTLTYSEAVMRALTREEQDRVHTRWSDAYPPAYGLPIKLCELEGPRYTCSYALSTRKDATSVFRSVCRVGGKQGWFYSNWLWNLRGLLDRMLMGVGTSRGRRSASTLRIDDVIDFWRVEDLRPDRVLLLRSEMKLPGMAWLEFRICPEEGRNQLIVNAHYMTQTLLGKMYWYLCLPFHHFIFKNLISNIEERS